MDTTIKKETQIMVPEIDWTQIKTVQLGLVKFEVDFENHTWVTARGIEISVKEMSTNHINNCINCFNGNGNMHIPSDYLGGREKWLGIFSRELTRRN
ncbi:MAG: hypothetical protein AABY15_02235 [Nanoarchaeota archaeon]